MPGKFELKKSANNQFMFNLKASNGQVILTSEQYVEKRGAESGIASVKQNAEDDGRYERKTASDGSPYFVLKASNGQVIGQSEMYSSAAAMENGIESVKSHAQTAEIDSANLHNTFTEKRPVSSETLAKLRFFLVFLRALRFFAVDFRFFWASPTAA